MNTKWVNEWNYEEGIIIYFLGKSGLYHYYRLLLLRAFPLYWQIEIEIERGMGRGGEHHGKERKMEKRWRRGWFGDEWRALGAEQKGAEEGMSSVGKFLVLPQKASASWEGTGRGKTWGNLRASLWTADKNTVAFGCDDVLSTGTKMEHGLCRPLMVLWSPLNATVCQTGFGFISETI